MRLGSGPLSAYSVSAFKDSSVWFWGVVLHDTQKWLQRFRRLNIAVLRVTVGNTQEEAGTRAEYSAAEREPSSYCLVQSAKNIHELCSMWRPVAAVSDRVSRWKSIGMIPFDFNFALHRRCKIPKCNSQPSLDRIFPSNAREKPRRRRRASYVADLDAHSRGRFDLIPTRRH